MKVLVTGADGFVGRYLVRLLVGRGDQVVAAVRPGGADPQVWLPEDGRNRIEMVDLELTDRHGADAVAEHSVDGMVHLAGLASGTEARVHPDEAWAANVLGTLRLLDAVAARPGSGAGTRVLVISTAEVYGRGIGQARTENDRIDPVSPYAASKAAAEIAAGDVARRTGLAVMVARPFPHTGVGQITKYVIPSFLERLIEARRQGAVTIATGNLDPVRDILDVRDVVEAYVALLERGTAGEAYNIASGTGYSVLEILRIMAGLVGIDAEPQPDPALRRPADIPHLVGDASKLRDATGWQPRIPFEQTLAEMVHAQTN
jgi:GDP-4-dehydro-6-deoxy-D-mannose reductase